MLVDGWVGVMETVVLVQGGVEDDTEEEGVMVDEEEEEAPVLQLVLVLLDLVWL
jgi:hypothetical protein